MDPELNRPIEDLDQKGDSRRKPFDAVPEPTLGDVHRFLRRRLLKRAKVHGVIAFGLFLVSEWLLAFRGSSWGLAVMLVCCVFGAIAIMSWFDAWQEKTNARVADAITTLYEGRLDQGELP